MKSLLRLLCLLQGGAADTAVLSCGNCDCHSKGVLIFAREDNEYKLIREHQL